MLGDEDSHSQAEYDWHHGAMPIGLSGAELG
jgi:hypothetical protein